MIRKQEVEVWRTRKPDGKEKKYLQPTTRDIYDTCLIGASSIVRQHNQEGNESVEKLLVKGM
jgi:hypothetical protein